MEDEMINIDEFLPLGEPEKEEKKPTVFSKEAEFDTKFLDEEEEEEKPIDDQEEEEEQEEGSFEDIIKDPAKEEEEQEEEEQDEQSKGLSKTFSKLFEKGTLIPFDDEKPIEKYTAKDWQELIEANIEEKTKDIQTKVQTDFFESLPEEIQSAAKYVMNGGRDIKGLFKILSDTQEINQLDVSNEEDQEIILRQFLSASNFGTSDEINEQIESWKEAGQMEKWAKKHKPKLDKMYEDVVQQELKQQEEFKELQKQRKEEFLDSIYQTLKKGELNGIKLDSKKQKFLWEEMTNTKYKSMSGRPTNLLGHLLEKYQFGEEKRYDLITEALWLLQDPEGYKEEVSKNKVKETNSKTVRALKTEQNRKNSSQNSEDEEEDKPRRIQRQPKNIFARN